MKIKVKNKKYNVQIINNFLFFIVKRNIFGIKQLENGIKP